MAIRSLFVTHGCLSVYFYKLDLNYAFCFISRFMLTNTLPGLIVDIGYCRKFCYLYPDLGIQVE